LQRSAGRSEIGAWTPGILDEHRLAILSFPQVETLLREGGFDRIETFNGYESRASEHLDGARMMVAAWKS